MLCIIIFLYLPDKISWSSSTNRSINHRLKYNYCVQSFTMSTEICLPEGLIELNPSRFCHTWRVCLTLMKMVLITNTLLSVLHAQLYIDQNSILIYYEKYDNAVNNFTHLCHFQFVQPKLIYRRKIYSTYMQIPFLRKYISIFLYRNHLNFFYFWEGGGVLSLNRHLNHDFKILSLDFQFIFSWFLMFDLDWETCWICPSESQIRIRPTVLSTNL